MLTVYVPWRWMLHQAMMIHHVDRRRSHSDLDGSPLVERGENPDDQAGVRPPDHRTPIRQPEPATDQYTVSEHHSPYWVRCQWMYRPYARRP